MKKYDIVTFGSAVVDTFVHTDVSESHNFMHYPVGAKILIKELRYDIGGGGTNTAVAFSRLGLSTGCICNIGDDMEGKNILECLKKESVDFLGKIVKKEKSGYSVILDSKGGERTILTYKGANNDVSIKDISKKLNTKWIYYSALLGKSFETQKTLAKELHKRGTKIAFNPSSYIIDNLELRDLLKITEVLILNKEEAKMLSLKYNGKHGDLLLALRYLGPKIVVITDKDNPAECFDGNKRYYLLPHKEIKAVERTGAGDAFASGFVAGLVAGLPIQKCLEIGREESESVIQYLGAKNILLYGNIKKSTKLRLKK